MISNVALTQAISYPINARVRAFAFKRSKQRALLQLPNIVAMLWAVYYYKEVDERHHAGLTYATITAVVGVLLVAVS